MTIVAQRPLIIPADSRGGWVVHLPVVTFWLVVQLAGLAVALLHVPLAATYPPGERLGLQVLLALQIATASTLGPAISRSLGTLVVLVSMLWPALLLAGAMQVVPIHATVLAAAVSTGWLVGVVGVCSLTRVRAIHGLIVGLAVLVSVGGAAMAYLAVEFGSAGDSEATVPTGLLATPMLSAWRAADESLSWDWTILPLAAFTLAGLSCLAWQAFRSRNVNAMPSQDAH